VVEGAAPILTPDQRLRVFISSTLGELAPERDAVEAAIRTLRLTPVRFELGARAHGPAEVYRSYLEQSDVFVGIYWESYGGSGRTPRSRGSRTSSSAVAAGPSSSTSRSRLRSARQACTASSTACGTTRSCRIESSALRASSRSSSSTT
jgi:Domain of unknown function (DUF4062)